MLTLYCCDNAVATSEYVKNIYMIKHPEMLIEGTVEDIPYPDNANVIIIDGDERTGKTNCLLSSIPKNSQADFYIYEPEPSYSFKNEYESVIDEKFHITNLQELISVVNKESEKERYIIIDNFFDVIKFGSTDEQRAFAKIVTDCANNDPKCIFVFIARKFDFKIISEELFNVLTDQVIASLHFQNMLFSPGRTEVINNDTAVNSRVHKQIIID